MNERFKPVVDSFFSNFKYLLDRELSRLQKEDPDNFSEDAVLKLYAKNDFDEEKTKKEFKDLFIRRLYNEAFK